MATQEESTQHATQDNEHQETISLQQAMERALQNFEHNQLAASEKLLSQILQKHPQHAPAIHLLGLIANQVGNTARSLQLIGQAIKLSPKVGLYYSNYAEIARNTGDLTAAVDYGKKAIKVAPELAVAHSNLGIAYYDQNELELAKQAQLKALSINPTLVPALNNLGSIAREQKDLDQALDYYEQVIKLQPNYLESLCNWGACKLEQEDYESAVKALVKVIHQKKDYAEAHCNIGSAFIGLEMLDKAKEAFSNALRLKPEYPQAFIGLAKIHQEAREYEDACKAVKQAITLEDTKADAFVVYAGILMEMGHADEAEEMIHKALSLEPESLSALSIWGTLLTEKGELEEAEKVLNLADTFDHKNTHLASIAFAQVRKAKKDDHHFSRLREAEVETEKNGKKITKRKSIALNFALGKCYDDIKESQSAFPYFQKANDLKRSTFNFNIEEAKQQSREIQSVFTKEFFKERPFPANESKTPIVILGMPRSGTTLTEQIIASHPKVFGAGELRELTTLFNKQEAGDSNLYPLNTQRFTPEHFEKIGNDYLTYLETISQGAEFVTDKMPSNYFYLGLIHWIFPNAKIIHVKRNPVDTCLSCFTKNFQNGQYFSYDQRELAIFYKNYRSIMAHWRSVLPENSFYEIQYEELVSNNEQQARKLIEFCELEWDDACLESHKTRRNIRTASVSQVRQPIYQSSVQRWKPYEEFLSPLLNELGELAKE